jgi:hypothetical protein
VTKPDRAANIPAIHSKGIHAMTAPKTSAAAIAMIATLQAKRAGLVQTIDTGAERRKGLATAAEFGDVSASAALRKIEAEETEARGSLQNLDIVIGEMERTRDTLQAQEANELASQNAAELSEAIDGLLELDDEIDDALDHARALLAKREEFKREKSQILRRIPGKMAGSMIGRDSEPATSLLSYFDRYLGWLNAGVSYASITRISDWDSRYYGRQSPRQLERGPRELSPFELALRRAIAPSRASHSTIAVAQPKQATRR